MGFDTIEINLVLTILLIFTIRLGCFNVKTNYFILRKIIVRVRLVLTKGKINWVSLVRLRLVKFLWLD